MPKLLAAFLCTVCILTFSACQKELSNELPGNTEPPVINSGTSVFTLVGAPGSCMTPTLNGIYKAGIPTDTSNWLIVKAYVTAPGTYTISTTLGNGIKFSASGIFSQTGQQTIRLQASGTTAAAGNFDFFVGTNPCKFVVSCVPGSVAATCKECVYVPMCAGTKYSYNDTTSGIATVRSVEFLSSTDTTIGGKVFKKIVATNGTVYMSCVNGETTVVAYNPVSVGGNTVAQIKSTVIKANAPIGTQWTDTLLNPAGQVVLQQYTIQTKGISRKIGTETFNDVIIVSLQTGVEVPGFGFISASLTKYLYAPNVGLIEVITEDAISGMVFYHSTIKSYFIP